jgi:hypothetical protein
MTGSVQIYPHMEPSEFSKGRSRNVSRVSLRDPSPWTNMGSCLIEIGIHPPVQARRDGSYGSRLLKFFWPALAICEALRSHLGVCFGVLVCVDGFYFKLLVAFRAFNVHRGAELCSTLQAFVLHMPSPCSCTRGATCMALYFLRVSQSQSCAPQLGHTTLFVASNSVPHFRHLYFMRSPPGLAKQLEYIRYPHIVYIRKFV